MNDELHTILARLHRFHEGVLLINERFEKTHFVLDPATRRPVFCAQPGSLDALNLTLHIPEDEAGALHIFGRAEALDAFRDEACDRYLFYFGRARWPHFAALTIDHAKSTDMVADGSDLMVENPLRGIEAALCREMNKDPRAVAAVCRRALNITPVTPKLVGVDPYGVDIRAEFGPVRVEFDAADGPVMDEKNAHRTLQTLFFGL